MIFGREINRPLALVTETEHAALATVVSAVPTQQNPFGANRLFMLASDEDLRFATQISWGAELLRLEGEGRQRDAPVRYVGQRAANTLDSYPQWWLTGGEFATFLAATYLVATQIPRPRPHEAASERAADYRAVRTARTFGALFMRAVPEARFTAPSRQTFVEGYNEPQTKYRKLAILGAQDILKKTHDEFRAAAPPQDPYQHLVGQSASAAILAFKQYGIENPLLMELANEPL